ncbi:hypothetical protein IFR05_016877 [Cadophora sp. M221]|nr:hypothetical protein IFR05_016877 [Cadophora sp. M221]
MSGEDSFRTKVEKQLGRPVTIGPEQSGDGTIKSGEDFGHTFSAVIIAASDKGPGSLRVTGGNKKLVGATVGEGKEGPFVVEVETGQMCTFGGYYTVKLVYNT